MSTPAMDVEQLARDLRALPAVRAKSSIGVVADVLGGGDWFAGPGDDGAVVRSAGQNLVVGGEALLPEFVARDPRGAGISAVLANVNDLAAMGARPLAIVNTVVGPRDAARAMLEGMKWAADVYDVPVVGGHTTETDGPPALSAFGLGVAEAVLSATRTAVGHTLLVVCCLEGSMREDYLFFPSFRERGDRLAGDVRMFADLARDGLAVAAKDISMAGLVGSLAMLLEANRLGVDVDLSRLPVPDGVSTGDWLACFPCFGFLVTTPPERAADLAAVVEGRGLSVAAVGTVDDSGLVRLTDGGRTAVVFDLARESVTRLGR